MTGYNAAFLIDGPTRDSLIADDPKSAEILKPILRGRDIGRYRAEWAGLWLIATLPSLSIDIDEYPAVKKHLLSFGRRRLSQTGTVHSDGTKSRKKTPHRWFEMQDTCAYHAEFSRKKLLWMDMSTQGRFAMSDTTVFCNDKGFILTGGSLPYLCAILNSHLVSWLMRATGLTTGMGQLQWKKFAVENIPVPRLSPSDEDPLHRVVDAIVTAKGADAQSDTSAFEAELDRMVYRLYGLNGRDIAAIA